MDTAVVRYLRGDHQDAFRLFNEILDVDVDHIDTVFNEEGSNSELDRIFI